MQNRNVFVSHASEDKGFVKNLTDTLIRFNLTVWYDEYEIDIGDSIRQKVNEGLLSCDYGVVVLTPTFFKKKWPKRELAALAELLDEGRLLPILHGISITDLRAIDPLLVDVRAEPSNNEARSTAAKIARKVLGTTVRDQDGRALYSRQTVRITDLPMDEDWVIADALFEDCVIQGHAVLVIHESVSFESVTFNTLHNFIPVTSPATTGTIGIRNITFRRSRFKDIGFVVTPARYEALARELPHDSSKIWPPHLQ